MLRRCSPSDRRPSRRGRERKAPSRRARWDPRRSWTPPRFREGRLRGGRVWPDRASTS
jgi:hypothetical protein